MRKNSASNTTYLDPPETLDDHPFFGLKLDEDQKALVDAVWSRSKKVYLIDSIAGSGKTLISTALGVLMVKYGIFSKMVYVTFPGIYEKTQGFLPGDLLEKSEPYFQPLYDALIEIGELPDHVCNTSQEALKNSTSFIECAVSTYMRGINLKNAFVVIDEAENADLSTLAKVMSRINDDCIALVIGHSGQCDMYDKTQSGFAACIDYQTKYHPDIAQRFDFRTNHRGDISKYADLMLQEYQPPKYGFVYVTENLKTRDIYLGKHARLMDKNDIDDTWYLGSDNELVEDIVRYGKDNFKRYIIYDCSSELELDYMYYLFKTYRSRISNEKFLDIVVNSKDPTEELTEAINSVSTEYDTKIGIRSLIDLNISHKF